MEKIYNINSANDPDVYKYENIKLHIEVDGMHYYIVEHCFGRYNFKEAFDKIRIEILKKEISKNNLKIQRNQVSLQN